MKKNGIQKATSNVHEVATASPIGRQMLNKVPQITIFFWIVKVLTTGMGEVASDFLAHQLNPVIAVGLAGICLAAALALQISVRRYITWIYWLSVIMVSIFGTMAADVLHIGFGIPYIISTIFFVAALAIIFIVWYVNEKTLSIHSIYTRRREIFYWFTIMATFALGTAAGDMTATTMHLGYFLSGIMFTLLIVIPALGYLWFGLNEVFTFWFAYIITRPLGASFADWVGVSHSRGGLGLGTGLVSLVLLIIIISFVYYLSISHKDINNENITTF
jgi:uncharacterized membrane-anchored protein